MPLCQYVLRLVSRISIAILPSSELVDDADTETYDHDDAEDFLNVPTDKFGSLASFV